MLKSKFPTFNNRNVALYYFLTIFMNGWFILPNWVFYFAQFISIPMVGLIDGVSKIVAVFLEVPSGAISDLVGKKVTLIMGNLFFVLGCIILLNSYDFVTLLIGNIVTFFGFAFVSGAKEAIIFDSLVDIKKEDRYEEVLGKVNSLAMTMTVISIFVGGLLYRFSPKLPFIAWMAYSIIAMIILAFMKEPRYDKEHLSYQAYFSKIKTGVASILNKPMMTFVLPVLLFSMLIKTYEGVVRQNTGAYFGFTGETFGYMLAIVSIPTLFVSFNYHRIFAKFKENIEYLFAVMYFFGFLIVYLTNNLIFGVFSFFLVYVAQEIVRPYILGLVNKHTESKHRATAISTVSLFSEFPYIILVTFFGSFIELDSIRYVYLGFCLVIGFYLILKKSITNLTQ